MASGKPSVHDLRARLLKPGIPPKFPEKTRLPDWHQRRVRVVSRRFYRGSHTIRVLVDEIYYDVGDAQLDALRADATPDELGLEPSSDQND